MKRSIIGLVVVAAVGAGRPRITCAAARRVEGAAGSPGGNSGRGGGGSGDRGAGLADRAGLADPGSAVARACR